MISHFYLPEDVHHFHSFWIIHILVPIQFGLSLFTLTEFNMQIKFILKSLGLFTIYFCGTSTGIYLLFILCRLLLHIEPWLA
ncbi:hypothetical protein BDB01DRAFT_804813 [Pilobolus umbonatus]|nr:hypothetical protein BDB01DRAFT_804813 [Pilobolus umbonatus]